MGGTNSKKTSPKAVPPYVPASKKFLKNYALGKELGKGAYGVVNLGTNKSTGEVRAIKQIVKQHGDEFFLSSLRREIDIIYQLSHPHIVKLYEVYEEKDQFYMVTELYNGGELFDRILSKERYTEREARDLVKIFLETIKYIHEKGVVHRDIKPENLLMRSNDNDADIILVDFGFAKRAAEITEDEEYCGTPNYMSPEIYRGRKYGCESDMWSIGVVVYILLAGYCPFYDPDQRKLQHKIKHGKYHFHERWDSISPEAIELIKGLICVDQNKRLTAAQALQHPWIVKSGDELEALDISSTLAELKRFNARRRFRMAANAIIMSNRMGKVLGLKPPWERRQEEEEIAAGRVEEPDLDKDIPEYSLPTPEEY